MRIVTSQQMKQIERNSMEYQMSYLRLMENAGCAAADFIRETLHSVQGLCCAVYCGKGNNAGDGFVVARKLWENGAEVSLVLVDAEPTTEDALQMYRLACSLGIPVLRFVEERGQVAQLMQELDVVVDAIYGSGFHGEFDEIHSEAALLINSAIAAVFALDIPSGICCDTGEQAANAVMADFTIALDSRKPAHLLPKYLPNLGRVQLCSIGIDVQAYEGLEQHYFVPEEAEIFAKIPAKAANAHKTSAGKLCNIAGSFACTGAAVLSSQAALRSGTGYLVTCLPREAYPLVATNLPQSTFRFLEEAVDVPPALKGCSAVAIGCGMGTGEKQRGILEAVLRFAKCPVVIDADGINNLLTDITIVSALQCPLILTPHFGEAARICKTSVQEVEKAPLRCAQKLATQLGCIVVLKGAHTVIAAPDGTVTINQSGNPGLAKAGSGDVLTGILASFLSQGMQPYDAAVAAVYLHGAAADRCANRLSVYYMQPDDILADLGDLLKENIPNP